MKCEKIFNKACEEKMSGNTERAYELFAEVVHDYPGTIFAIYANDEMMRLSVNNAKDSYTPSYVEEEAIAWYFKEQVMRQHIKAPFCVIIMQEGAFRNFNNGICNKELEIGIENISSVKYNNCNITELI